MHTCVQMRVTCHYRLPTTQLKYRGLSALRAIYFGFPIARNGCFGTVSIRIKFDIMVNSSKNNKYYVDNYWTMPNELFPLLFGGGRGRTGW